MATVPFEYPMDLLDPPGGPCLSLYQPTHRRPPDNRQDAVRFRNLIRALEASLVRQYPARDVEVWLAPFRRLAADEGFWLRALDGLAVFGSPSLFRVLRLQRTVPELAVVADSFHLKPLLRIAQSVERYQILGLARRDVCLYEGTRDALDEVPLAPGVPRTLTEALGEDVTEPSFTVASYGGAGQAASRHGSGSRKDEIDDDTVRFFRVVDRAILEQHSRRSQLPLLLAALPEHQAAFRQVSHNPYLLPERIDAHPEAIGLERLRQRAWEVIGPRFERRIAETIERFQVARGQGLGEENIEPIADAVRQGRVGTLLVDGDRHVPGRIDGDGGRVVLAELDRPDVDDLLDDLGELVLRQKGQVLVLPGDRMPSQTGAAAIYRY